MTGSLPERPRGFRGAFRTDADARAVYSESAGIMRITPAAVAQPLDVPDLQTLCAWASQRHVALIPRGSGSSMSGAAVGPGVVVDLWHLRDAPVVDPHWEMLRAGAAVTQAEADRAAAALNLRVPVDPSSAAFATLGGMAATNAAGARSLSLGAVRPWIAGLDCVFADGSSARVHRGQPLDASNQILRAWQSIATSFREACRGLAPRGVRKDSSGYGLHAFAASGDLIDLLVGSEGTLAFLCAVDLRLQPRPAATAALLGGFDTLERAMRAIELAREAGVAACELLDATFLRIAARGGPLPVDVASAAVLLVEMDGASSVDVGVRTQALAAAWSAAGATTVRTGLDEASRHDVWELRHAASPILARMDPHIRSMQIVEDGCVPPDRLGEYVRGVHAALDRIGIEGVLFGHAGDAHLHVNALIDVRRAEWKSHVRRLFHDVCDLTRRLGGTLAGEHGDGRLRSWRLPDFWPPGALALFETLKRVFDPLGIMNPGVKVGPSTDPFADIKYDPDARLESPGARAVLDDIERHRGYARNRLEMVGGSG